MSKNNSSFVHVVNNENLLHKVVLIQRSCVVKSLPFERVGVLLKRRESFVPVEEKITKVYQKSEPIKSMIKVWLTYSNSYILNL
jgi:hypothetical protein